MCLFFSTNCIVHKCRQVRPQFLLTFSQHCKASVFCTQWGHLDLKGFVKSTVVYTKCAFLLGDARLEAVAPQDLVFCIGSPCLARHTCDTRKKKVIW